MANITRLQRAIFDRLTTDSIWDELANCHRIPVGQLKRAYESWSKHPTDGQPTYPSEILLAVRKAFRPPILTEEEETLVFDVSPHYIDHCMPLTKLDLTKLVAHVVTMLPASRHFPQRQKNRPSIGSTVS